MPGPSRDLAAQDLWQASLTRSRACRGLETSYLASILGGSPGAEILRDLCDGQPWELSQERSILRRRAELLQFVPARSRARRISLGALAALTAGPAASLSDATASPPATSANGPTTITEHY